MSVTHPTTRTQDNSMCHPFRAGANCSSTQGNLLFLLNSSILLKHDECSPVVLLCMCKILPEVHVEISQDVTVKKEHGSAQLVINYSVLQSPIMSCNMCTVTAKTRNIPGNVISPTDDGPSSIPSGQALPLINVHSYHQQLHNSFETQHDHNSTSAVYTDRLTSFPFLHLCNLHYVTTTEVHTSWVPLCPGSFILTSGT